MPPPSDQVQNPTKNEFRLVQMLARAGIKRDGTTFEGPYYTDGQWCRFQRQRPRKMGGYKNVSDLFSYPCRGSFGYSKQGLLYANAGSPGNLEVQQFDSMGGGGGLTDRTPGGFTSSSNNMWQFALMYDGGSSYARIIAHAAPNLTDIDNATARSIYSGDAYATSALTAITSSSVSGGIAVLYPYLFGFGSDGGVIWSVPNQPTDMSGAGSGNARITGSKIIYGTPTRGGAGNNPSGLFFALDALVRTTFVGGTPIFNFDQITNGYSILCSQGVVEFDGIYFWPGIDRWLSYNGVISEVVNDLCVNDFYDNLNYTYRQKVWGIANPRWGEIIWFWPRYPATEPNWMTVLNVREKTWYDTSIENMIGGRLHGFYSKTFRYPLWFGNESSAGGKTKLWMHEFGVDKVDGTRVDAIPFAVETNDMSLTSTGFGEQQIGEDANLVVKRIEPDFVMSGDATIKLIGRDYPQGIDQEIYSSSFNSSTKKLDPKVQARSLRVRVESNVAGGDIQFGQPLMLVGKKDGRPTGG